MKKLILVVFMIIALLGLSSCRRQETIKNEVESILENVITENIIMEDIIVENIITEDIITWDNIIIESWS